MPHDRLNFKGSKKRPSSGSVDGFTPKRQRPIVSPEYYGKEGPLSGGPRRPLAKRQPIDPETISTKKVVDETIELDDFDRPETDIFSNTYPEKTAKQVAGSRRDRRKAKEAAEGDGKKRGRLRTWWKNRSLKFKLGLVTAIVVIAGGSFLGVRLYSFLNSVFGKSVGNSKSAALNDDIDPSQLNTEGDGRLNVLLMGRGGTENEAPDLTDTMLIASIDLKNQTASMLSVPRDTWVESRGSNMKINAVYSTAKQYAIYRGKSNDEAEKAGIQAAIGIMREVAGVPIHKYVLTDYKAFRDVVNALGGVDVTVPEAIHDGFTGWNFKAGLQTMDGARALQYARTRHGSARGDFDRNENQRRLLLAMREKATSTGIVANPVRLNALANAVQKNIRTDLTVDEAKTLFEKTKLLPEKDIASLDLAKPEGPLVRTDSAGGGQSVVRPTEGFDDYTKIRAYARSNMIDPYLKKEGPKVAVYNGSGRTGMATTVGDVLASYGYKVLTKETSSSTQNKTLIIRINKTTKRPFTERFLSVRFGTVVTTSLPSGIVPAATTSASSSNSSSSTTTASTPQPDYIIVLGANFTTPSGSTW